MEKEIKIKKGEEKWICTCGHSKNLPFCDSTHKKINAQKGTSYKLLIIKNTFKKDMSIKAESENWNK